MQASHDNEDNSRQVDQLAFMQQMTRLVNKLQTTNPADGASYQPNSFTSGGGVAAGKHSHVPPEVSGSACRRSWGAARVEFPHRVGAAAVTWH